eukprot:2896095-Alexandrium_andersonii.AAC.1
MSSSTGAEPARRTTRTGVPCAGGTRGAQLDQRRSNGRGADTCSTGDALMASGPSQVARHGARAAKRPT